MLLDNKPTNRKSGGFTLIELSIVLVIIGLMVGGIVGGKALIHQARLQSVVREYNEYTTAYNTFLAQFDAIPGDFQEGYVYFSGGSNRTCGKNTTDREGCNGDGDGRFDYTATSDADFLERSRAWMHLELSEIIHGKVSKLGTHVYDNTVPESKRYTSYNGWNYSGAPDSNGIEGAVWKFSTPGGVIGGFPTTYFGKSGNFLEFRGFEWEINALTPPDAKNIDTKLDDGKPGQGKLLAFGNSNNNRCGTGCNLEFYNIGSPTNCSYRLDNTTLQCNLLFYIGQ